MPENCPNCFGSGRVNVPNIDATGRHKLIVKEFVNTTCPVCHGSGMRPTWMDDERHKGFRDETFDYIAAQ